MSNVTKSMNYFQSCELSDVNVTTVGLEQRKKEVAGYGVICFACFTDLYAF